MSHKLKNRVKSKERIKPLREYREKLMAHKMEMLEVIANGLTAQGAPKKDEALEELFKMVREIK